jgi:hypothetical protein
MGNPQWELVKTSAVFNAAWRPTIEEILDSGGGGGASPDSGGGGGASSNFGNLTFPKLCLRTG